MAAHHRSTGQPLIVCFAIAFIVDQLTRQQYSAILESAANVVYPGEHFLLDTVLGWAIALAGRRIAKAVSP